MNAHVVTDYFLHPTETIHRRYEAIRAVFVEGLSLQEVAQRFEVSYGTIRNWASEFRREWDAGQPPPFSLARCVGVPREKACIRATNRRSKSPTRMSCRWKQDAD
jgi:transposase-like protein